MRWKWERWVFKRQKRLWSAEYLKITNLVFLITAWFPCLICSQSSTTAIRDHGVKAWWLEFYKIQVIWEPRLFPGLSAPKCSRQYRESGLRQGQQLSKIKRCAFWETLRFAAYAAESWKKNERIAGPVPECGITWKRISDQTLLQEVKDLILPCMLDPDKIDIPLREISKHRELETRLEEQFYQANLDEQEAARLPCSWPLHSSRIQMQSDMKRYESDIFSWVWRMGRSVLMTPRK